MTGTTTIKDGTQIDIDPFRAIVFPNHLRRLRRAAGFAKLLAVAQLIPEIPYIRLSKIERGEVVARPDELVRIAAELKVDADALLLDVDDPGFDIAAWAASGQQQPRPAERQEAEFAVRLAAAIRCRRLADPTLTIGRLDTEYGIPPVILSRLENAHKTFDRWNSATIQAIFRLFDVADRPALESAVAALQARGELDARIAELSGPEPRMARTRAKVAELRARLTEAPAPPSAAEPVFAALEPQPKRRLPVFGAPLPDGLIAMVATGQTAEAPGAAGPRAYALRVHRPTLGAGLPGSSVIVLDPDRFPVAGGIAAVREKDGVRLLAVTFDRQGAMIGYSVNPDREIALDPIPPGDIAAAIAAYFD
jgi:hypothetical protein